MTSAEMDELVRRANASGFETVADYAVALEEALRAMLDADEDCLAGAFDEGPCLCRVCERARTLLRWTEKAA